MTPSNVSFAPRATRAGFTLVELMVSLVISGLIIAVVLQWVTGQTRFASVQTAREEVQQNARGALEIVASDLRGAVSGGIRQADAQRIDFMLPRRWGVVCANNGATETIVAFPNLPGEGLPTGAGAGLLVLGPAGWLPASNQALATVTGVAAVPLADVPGCGNQGITGDAVAFRLTGANHPAGTAGLTAAVYQLVRYDVADGTGGTWIRRSNGWTGDGPTMQPLAGPVDAAQVGFRYFAGDPAGPPSLIAAPGANAPAANIRMVRFRVRMTSRHALDGSVRQQEQDSATVQIRN